MNLGSTATGRAPIHLLRHNDTLYHVPHGIEDVKYGGCAYAAGTVLSILLV